MGKRTLLIEAISRYSDFNVAARERKGKKLRRRQLIERELYHTQCRKYDFGNDSCRNKIFFIMARLPWTRIEYLILIHIFLSRHFFSFAFRFVSFRSLPVMWSATTKLYVIVQFPKPRLFHPQNRFFFSTFSSEITEFEQSKKHIIADC